MAHVGGQLPTSDVDHTYTTTGINHRKLLMWVFLGSDCLFFGSLIATYMVYRGQSLVGPYPIDILDIPLTTISTFVLLCSSFAMVQALAATNKNDQKGNYVLAKRRVKRKDGGVNSPPKVVDSNNTPMHNTLIGNGSLVNVKFSPYEWTFGNKQGIGLDLQAVQVVDLVEYSTGEEEFDPVSGVYQASDEDIPFPTN